MIVCTLRLAQFAYFPTYIYIDIYIYGCSIKTAFQSLNNKTVQKKNKIKFNSIYTVKVWPCGKYIAGT